MKQGVYNAPSALIKEDRPLYRATIATDEVAFLEDYKTSKRRRIISL